MKIGVWIQKTEYEELDVEFPVYTKRSIAEDYIVYNRLDEDGTLLSIRKDGVSIMISRTHRNMSEGLDASLLPNDELGDSVCTVEEFTQMLDQVNGWLYQAYQDVSGDNPGRHN